MKFLITVGRIFFFSSQHEPIHTDHGLVM